MVQDNLKNPGLQPFLEVLPTNSSVSTKQIKASPDRSPISLYLLLVFSVDFEPPELLHHFMEHYLLLKVPPENFLIILHSLAAENPKMSTIVDLLHSFGVKAKHTWIGEFLRPGKLQAEQYVLDTWIGKDRQKWVLTTDADELQIYLPQKKSQRVIRIPGSNQVTRNVHDVISEAVRAKKVAITGIFLDRTTKDCSLRDIAASPSLWSQFPNVANITKRILKGFQDKVLAHSGNYRARSGHHFMHNHESLQRRNLTWSDYTHFQVNHFKWIPSVIGKLERRVEQFRKAGEPVYKESERFLNHFNRTGKIC